jgi:hypothetical protein
VLLSDRVALAESVCVTVDVKVLDGVTCVVCDDVIDRPDVHVLDIIDEANDTVQVWLCVESPMVRDCESDADNVAVSGCGVRVNVVVNGCGENDDVAVSGCLLHLRPPNLGRHKQTHVSSFDMYMSRVPVMLQSVCGMQTRVVQSGPAKPAMQVH